jgi:hypothetical protein
VRPRAVSPLRLEGRWGVHPVLEPALAALGEDDLPPEIERSLPPPGALTTRGLVRVAALCLAHARLGLARSSADFERLAALVDRQAAAPPHVVAREPWHGELAHARRDFEHGRGAVRIAARAAEVAWCDVVRRAPGAGVEASVIAADVVRRTAKLLGGDRDALVRFVTALLGAVAAERGPRGYHRRQLF